MSRLPRPYVVASCAVSLDGFLDDSSAARLVLSNEADLDRVDEVRAGCDAILVGAETVRRDNPRLLVRSDVRRQARVAAGLPENPVKVTLTTSGDLDPDRAFFTAGDAPKLVYAASGAVAGLRERLGEAATVIDAGSVVDLPTVLADLAARGVRRLLVEGGGRVHTAFLGADLVDELQLVVAPFLVGDEQAPRWVGTGPFPHDPGRPMRLVEVRQLGEVVLLRYALTAADRFWLGEAIEESRRCPRSETAYAVGAIIVDRDGREIARGYSRESDPRVHAEEAALAKVDLGDPRLPTATIYSSLEPCSVRASRPRPCAELILDAGIRRVVFAWREPDLFVDCRGAEVLTGAGVDVVELPDLAPLVRDVNAHLFAGRRGRPDDR
ncbi:dihydrofolate reductase family protein [Actinopolymorpha alba]|uniref:dihydrofolate reductase family protein n=1 Tax=Actinopolymorpha alba TaxID=533267 RepID=UPI00035C841C|nr:dihydrofolate reductase family protein [Actinopolymorpha alba]